MTDAIIDGSTCLISKLHCVSTVNAEPFYRASGFMTIGPVAVSMAPDLTFPGIRMRRALA